jgi:hypothetical protein
MRTGDFETSDPPLGQCPTCETAIPRSDLVVAYETPDGWPRMLAACPACEVTVHPM